MVFKYNNFAELNKIQKELAESLSKDFWRDDSEQAKTKFPPVDIYETDDTIVVIVGLPGLKKISDVNISISNNILVIKGTMEKGYTQNQLLQDEISSGEFKRKILLPAVVDNVKSKAGYKNGLLTIVFSKDVNYHEQKINIDFFE